MKKEEYSMQVQYIDIGLRVSGYEMPMDLIQLILATDRLVTEKGGEITLSETLALKKEHIKENKKD